MLVETQSGEQGVRREVVPKGEYRQIQFLLVDAESGSTEVINHPWN
jgi:hypothetical protein